MDKSLILDFKVLNELSLSVHEFLFLASCHPDLDIRMNFINVDVHDLEMRQFIKIIYEKNEQIIILRNKSNELLDLLIVDTDNSLETKTKKVNKSKSKVNQEVNERVAEFRALWKGLKPGSMGSAKACKEKLTRWMRENPEYDFDQILKAAELYINTEGRDLRFLQRADYFIFKQDVHKGEASRLSAFIDEVEEGETSTGDWTSKIN